MATHILSAIASFFAIGFLCVLPANAAGAAEARLFQSGGKTIRVDFYSPPAGRDTHRTILVLHGAGGMFFDGPEMRRMAQRLAREGNSVYLLHYFNRTDSLFFAGDGGMQKNFDTWVATIRDAILWARQEQTHERDMPIALYGYSLGAFLALAAASDNPAVGAVAEQSGGIWNNDARRIGRMPPVLMIHGRADQRVPFAKYALPLMKLLRERGTVVETRFYPSEGHRFSGGAQAQVREQVAEFFRRRLPIAR